MPASHPQRLPDPQRPDAGERRGWVRTADVAALEVVADIVIQTGAEGEHLARRQTRVLWEVTEWLTQHAADHQRPAA
jgi:hypothetical protein